MPADDDTKLDPVTTITWRNALDCTIFDDGNGTVQPGAADTIPAWEVCLHPPEQFQDPLNLVPLSTGTVDGPDVCIPRSEKPVTEVTATTDTGLTLYMPGKVAGRSVQFLHRMLYFCSK